MLDSFDVRDLLPGMTVCCRSGAPFKLFPGMPLARFLSGDYAEDLTHKSGETDLDLMQVSLPSGTVLWERPDTIDRVFDLGLWRNAQPFSFPADAYIAMHPEETTERDGKVFSFPRPHPISNPTRVSAAPAGNGDFIQWAWTVDLPAVRPCSGCARLESDPLCGSCLRNGHGATVDFYQARTKA